MSLFLVRKRFVFINRVKAVSLVGPPKTSRVTPAGVTRITPGNSGYGNFVSAVNRVANALTRVHCLFTSATLQHKRMPLYRSAFDAFFA